MPARLDHATTSDRYRAAHNQSMVDLTADHVYREISTAVREGSDRDDGVTVALYDAYRAAVGHTAGLWRTAGHGSTRRTKTVEPFAFAPVDRAEVPSDVTRSVGGPQRVTDPKSRIRVVYDGWMGYTWALVALARLSGIEAHEVLQALTNGRPWPRLAVGPGGIPVLTIWGRTPAGRYLITAVRQIGPFDWQILGARDMRPTEAAEYDSWEAQQ